jgi:hypothetical protein
MNLIPIQPINSLQSILEATQSIIRDAKNHNINAFKITFFMPQTFLSGLKTIRYFLPI